MKLKEIYTKGGTVWHNKIGNVRIVNDSSNFKTYKKDE